MQRLRATGHAQTPLSPCLHAYLRYGPFEPVKDEPSTPKSISARREKAEDEAERWRNHLTIAALDMEIDFPTVGKAGEHTPSHGCSSAPKRLGDAKEDDEPPRKKIRQSAASQRTPEATQSQTTSCPVPADALGRLGMPQEHGESTPQDTTPREMALRQRVPSLQSPLRRDHTRPFLCSLTERTDGRRLIEIQFDADCPSGGTVGTLTIKAEVTDDFYHAFNAALKLLSVWKSSYARTNVTMSLTGSLSVPKLLLNLSVWWRNATSLGEARSDIQNNLLLFPFGTTKPKRSEGWTPRLFYDSVHLPKGTASKIQVPGIQLYPFQRRAVEWMLQREGVDLGGRSLPEAAKNDLAHGFTSMTDITGTRCLVNSWLGIITTDERIIPPMLRRGGILAEEMGLGKTIEIISLVQLHKRTQEARGSPIGLQQAPATLVIAPSSILKQWASELEHHAPDLQFTVYNGINASVKRSDGTMKEKKQQKKRSKQSAKVPDTEQSLIEHLLLHDVVLVTYPTLAKELHYATAPSERALRHEKSYVPRRSPLVQIDWWRVVLDECQLIEGGVSNAAKVANEISRVNAWAVSGTPLKTDSRDLFALLSFLRLEPYNRSAQLWSSLLVHHKATFKQLISMICIRHAKEQVKIDIQLPPQKRIVISVPFTPIEEQHYASLFQEMAEACGLDVDGAPVAENWDPQDASIVEMMRSWLARLRQTCLHPEVGALNRKALGRKEGPLRTVQQVLLVMIDQNESHIRTSERASLAAMIERGRLLANARRPLDAMAVWSEVRKQSAVLVDEARRATAAAEKQNKRTITESDEDTAVRGRLRNRLRLALQLHHNAIFFCATAYFQVHGDEKHPLENEDKKKEFQDLETTSYDYAKRVRKELMTNVSTDVGQYMNIIETRHRTNNLITTRSTCDYGSGGLESRDIVNELQLVCQLLDDQAELLNQWREKLVEIITSPLLDQETVEITGDEYEDSTKIQDESHAYIEAIAAMISSRSEVLTALQNKKAVFNVDLAYRKARDGEGHSPELMRNLLLKWDEMRPQKAPSGHVMCLRGVLAQLGQLKGSLQVKERTAEFSAQRTRYLKEIAIIDQILPRLKADNAEQSKNLTAMEKDLQLLSDTINARVEYYKQLQEISDSVRLIEEPIEEEELMWRLRKTHEEEGAASRRTKTCKGQANYLQHLQESSMKNVDVERKCIICQDAFDIGALTSCGHVFCKTCLAMWWHSHRSCPICKKRLGKDDMHQITYKPSELSLKEEMQPGSQGPEMADADSSIYSGITAKQLDQIRNIDIGHQSYGTKLDTIARHILWIRENNTGAKSLIFSQFKDFLDVLSRAFDTFKIGYASVDSKDGIERFKRNPSIECFLLHAKAQASGLNLVNATNVFLCEPLLNTSIELQAIARIHRIGQHNETTVWMYLVDDTVEKAIYDMSVERRMSHIALSHSIKNQKHKLTTRPEANPETGESLEDEIDAANSYQLEDLPVHRLLTGGKGGGEQVPSSDLWQCLFKCKPSVCEAAVPEGAAKMSAGFLGAEAADARRGEIEPGLDSQA